MPSATAAASFIGCTKAYLPQHMAGEASTMKWNAFLNKIIHLGSHWSHLSLVSKLQACFNVKDRMLILWGTFSLIKNPFCWMFKTLQTWIPWKGHQLDFSSGFHTGPPKHPGKKWPEIDVLLFHIFYQQIYYDLLCFTIFHFIFTIFYQWIDILLTSSAQISWASEKVSASTAQVAAILVAKLGSERVVRTSSPLRWKMMEHWIPYGCHMDAIWHMIYLGIGIHISHVPSFDMAYGIHLMIFDDIWWYLMLFDDIWWYLMIFEDIWWYLILDDIGWYRHLTIGVDWRHELDLNAMKYGWMRIGWHELWWDPCAEERVGVEETLINMQHSSMSAKMGVRLGAGSGWHALLNVSSTCHWRVIHVKVGGQVRYSRCPINAGEDPHFASCRGECECIISCICCILY